jgi:uncharacterized protein (DUF433 family)
MGARAIAAGDIEGVRDVQYNVLIMTTHSSAHASTYVERKPTVCGGRPVIRGTRFLVSEVVWHYKRGLSVEEILQHFPTLQQRKSMALWPTTTNTSLKLRRR